MNNLYMRVSRSSESVPITSWNYCRYKWLITIRNGVTCEMSRYEHVPNRFIFSKRYYFKQDKCLGDAVSQYSPQLSTNKGYTLPVARCSHIFSLRESSLMCSSLPAAVDARRSSAAIEKRRMFAR